MQEFRLPDPGEGLTEAEIVSWRVRPGDTVAVNDVLLEVETAKSLVELPSPFEGTVEALLVEQGQTVEVGTPIIRVAGGDPDAVESGTPTEETVEPDASGGAVLVGYGVRGGAETRRRKPRTLQEPPAQAAPRAAAPAAVPAPAAAVPDGPAAPRDASAPVLAKPPVRKLAKDLGVDLRQVTPTGPIGDVTRDDVQRAAQAPAEAPRPAASARAAWTGGREERIPVKGVRRATAQAMAQSAFTAPHVSVFTEVDATRTMELVKRLKASDGFAGVKVSPLLVMAKAILWAIERAPEVNSTFTPEELVVHRYVNLGIAAATPRGLLVPNIKDAQDLSLVDLARAIEQLTLTAREGRTPPVDMQHGTFTITNIGVFGMDTGTPILNPGETGIIALGAIRQKPWVVDGEVRPRWVTTVGGSFDHRAVDGDVISRFVADVASILEEPALLVD
ncbi:dihydrolipoamide acetyltransferase family protein [Agrococcus sp. Marseille-Q4369]|uniref:dihydrolipoamide acetyltransferase family protein n=1 Tax=Agrococcus sp. Marseille-Q4369 TaxID=2810513 RepID=UPI001B8BE363|nr:dihydrolipoamide acetyltransferase family protein [Agrococcus sp. Marseille-Q4369]QUW17951.1 2-oxo acid dehydrogenase subunit E2 [Agrococcus sp. Marseille-Q4369]